MNVYLATKFTNAEGFQAVKKLLEDNGHTLTHDWSQEDASKVPEAERPEYLQKCAMADAEGISAAECFVLLAVPNMSGALTELGIALGLGVPVIILGAFEEGNQNNIFYHLPVCGVFQHLKTTDALLRILSFKPSDDFYQKIGTEGPNGSQPVMPDDNQTLIQGNN